MSAPLSPHARPLPRRTAGAALGALAIGLAALLAAAPTSAVCAVQPDAPEKDAKDAKEPPGSRSQSAKDKVPEPDPGAVDTRRPVPADAPGRQARERLALPNRPGSVFAAIRDFEPVANQKQNPREYDAWVEAVLHAQQQKARDLDEYAARDLAPINLTQTPDQYRCDLVRFDGQLVSARRLAVTADLLLRSDVAELYEVRLVPLDESPVNPVAVVVHQLPPALAAAVKKQKPDAWVDADGWVTASGYFFKAMSVPAEAPGASASLPLLVGKGLTPLDGPPPGAPAPAAFDRGLRIFKSIRDDIKAGRPGAGSEAWFEYAAYSRAVLRAARFSADELERDAATDLRFADLFEDGRTAHRMALVRFEGRLISLRKTEPNEWLAAGGVKHLYEGWLIPENEPRGNPICVVFTEPLEGVEPARRVNKWVSFAGYSFKRLRYESAEEDPKEKGKRVDKLAPLLIGKCPIARKDPGGGSIVTWMAFVNGVLIVIGLLVLSAGAFALWYRRGDRQARAQMDSMRGRNPFAPGAAAPADGERP